MPAFAYFIIIFLKTVLFAIEIAMFLRAILSWLPGTEELSINAFLVMITEPFIVPIRSIFDYFGWFRNLPLDISFFVTYILISILSTILEVIV